MKYVAFDIETGPLPEDELQALKPEFQAAKNLRDPAKIEADIAAKIQAWHDDAALSAITGRVVAIAYSRDDEAGPDQVPILDIDPDEVGLIKRFWDHYEDRDWAHCWAGFNIYSFDLPFLIRRSWKHKLRVPHVRDRWWATRLVDLRDTWQLGDRQAHGNLDQVCRHLGLGKKEGSGADFAGLLVTDPDKARAYLLNDITLTAKLCKTLLV